MCTSPDGRHTLTLRLFNLPWQRISNIWLKYLLCLLKQFFFPGNFIIELNATRLHFIECILRLLLIFICHFFGELGSHMELRTWSAVSSYDIIWILGLILIKSIWVPLICSLAVPSVIIIIDYICFGILWLLLMTLLHNRDLLTKLTTDKLLSILAFVTTCGILTGSDLLIDGLTVLEILFRDCRAI